MNQTQKWIIYSVIVLFSEFRIHRAHTDLPIKKTRPYPGIQECISPGLFALTFDDGPSTNGRTLQVLEILREKKVQATFFVTGQGHVTPNQNSKVESLLKQIFDEGHQIGSHTWSHLNLIDGMTAEQIHDDVSRLSNMIWDVLKVNMTILRPPYGYINNTVVKLIQNEFGYKIVRWNLDTNDWYYGKNLEASFKRYEFKMKNASSSSQSFISLHHDPNPRSAELASKAIDYIRSKGFRLVTVGECIGVPKFL